MANGICLELVSIRNVITLCDKHRPELCSENIIPLA
jgi:hypothetical protein